MKMRVEVDEERCIGSLGCEGVCPEVFKVLGDISEVLVEVVPPGAEERCRRAVQDCPARAIRILPD
jgi:ferredoxin